MSTWIWTKAEAVMAEQAGKEYDFCQIFSPVIDKFYFQPNEGFREKIFG
jgi:hypothetical protein